MERILVSRKEAFGDVLCAASLVRRLKLLKPQAELSFAADSGYMDVFHDNPDVEHVYPSGAVPVWSEGNIIELAGAYENRPQLNILAAYGEAAGGAILNTTIFQAIARPKIYIGVAERTRARFRMQGKKLVGVHPGPVWKTRAWPKERWVQLEGLLHAAGYRVVVFHDQREEPPIKGDLLPEMANVLDLAARVERCRIIVGVDSLIVHLAQAMKVPSVSLWGGTEPEKRLYHYVCGDITPNAEAVSSSSASCRGCHHRSAGKRETLTCERADGAPYECLETIAPEQVMAAVGRAEIRATQRKGESSKVRNRVEVMLYGRRGLDIACGNDPILPEAIAIDWRDIPYADARLPADDLRPIPDEWVDYVYSSHCLEHLRDMDKALREWNRVLKPHGLLVLFLPDGRYKEPNPEHLHKFEMPDILAMLPEYEIRIAEKEPYDYSFLIVARKRG